MAPVGQSLDERQLYLDVMRERLQATSASLARGLSHAARLEAEARERLRRRLESLRHKRDSLEARLATAAHTARDTFDALRSEIDESWSDLEAQWADVERQLGDSD